MKSNKYEIDMCNGSIMDKLVSFALPLMLSGILQLMFNAVDIIVVGRFSGSEALAAVGSTTALINVFTNLFIGISLGANVLAARFFAAGRREEMSETVHTSITLALISGILMAFVGLVFSKGALELMGTPEDVIGLSTLYMRIYFMGMPFFMLYNYGAAILRAVGDTKRPLYFLIIAGVINAGLNMVLVIVFGLGVAGVGIATVFSQMVSCVLVLTCLCRAEGSYKLSFSKLSMKGYYLKQIFQVGIPAGIQSTVINFSNALLQSSVNSFGSTAMAGYTAANNILGFLYVSINSVTQACMSFTSQNFGVGKYKRMDRVLIDCMILSVGAALVLGCGLQSAGFCHKGGFLMTVGMLEDAVKACRISMELYHENPTIVNLGGDSCIDPLLKQLPGMQEATVIHMDFMQLPELTVDGIYGEAAMDKQQWKNEVKENLKRILKQKPEAVYVEGNVFETYPIVHQLRKKHIPVLTMMEKDGQKLIIQIPSGS